MAYQNAGQIRSCGKIAIPVLPITAARDGPSYIESMISKDKAMWNTSRYPGDPLPRHAAEWRHRVPSHELMMLGVPEWTDFPNRTSDRRAHAGRLFWQS